MQFSQIKDKKIVAVNSAEELGRVDGLYIDRDTYAVKYISVDDGMHILAPDKIYAFGDVLTVLNTSAREPKSNSNGLLWYDNGLPVYGVSGEKLGVSTDIELVSRKKQPLFFVGEKSFKLKTVTASSRTMLVVNPTYRLLLPKIRKPKPQSIGGVIVQPLLEGNDAFAFTPAAAEPITSPDTDEITVSDYSFLLGRKLNSEVADLSRSFVLMAGTLITDRVIANARKAGKIVDLVIKSS